MVLLRVNVGTPVGERNPLGTEQIRVLDLVDNSFGYKVFTSLKSVRFGVCFSSKKCEESLSQLVYVGLSNSD